VCPVCQEVVCHHAAPFTSPDRAQGLEREKDVPERQAVGMQVARQIEKRG
jgi:hypothetical protein